MTTCTIYYPGLLGPDIPLEELPAGDWPRADQLPQLTKVLAHASQQPLRRCSNEARMLYAMGIGFAADQDVPVAALRAAQVADVRADAPLWCLDPVCLRLDQDQAVLLGNDMLNLAESEARHLIDDLNAHFAQDGIQIHYLSPRQWLMQGQIDLTTHTPDDALLETINRYQPTGADANRWRSLLNEAQMLLHAHPVNQAREQRGEPTVNSLWLWGGGREYRYEKIIAAVYSNERLIHDAALACDIPHHFLPARLEAATLQAAHSLFVYTAQLPAIKNRDVYAWFTQLAELERNILAPLCSLLQAKQLSTFTLCSDTLSFTFGRKQLKRWWWRKKNLAAVILRLRQHDTHSA